MTRYTTKQKLEALKRGVELPVDPYAMAHREVGQVPPPDERAVLILAQVYQQIEDPGACATSWDNQVKAAGYFNAVGLTRTLDEIYRLDPTALEPPREPTNPPPLRLHGPPGHPPGVSSRRAGGGYRK